MQTELIQIFFTERCTLGKGGQAEAGPGHRAPPPSQGMTASKRLSSFSLLCFPGGAGFTGQTKWPAGQKGGDLVQAPVGSGPPQANEEVLWGQVVRSPFVDGDLQQACTSSLPSALSLPQTTPRGAAVAEQHKKAPKSSQLSFSPGYLLSYITSSCISQEYVESRWREESPSVLIKRILLSLVLTLKFNVVHT